MNRIIQDFRYALRRLTAQPAFTLTTTLTLALGIGMTTVIYSLVDVSVFRALPFDNAERLVFLQGYAESPDGPRIRGASWQEIRDWRERNRSFSRVVISDPAAFNLTGDGDGTAERIPGEFVTPGYFEMLGATPVIGRTFDAPGGEPVHEAILSEEFWSRRYNRDPDILGERVAMTMHSTDTYP